VTIRPPAVPLVANVTASPVSDPEAIRKLLVEQVTATVRWRESVQAMATRGVSCLVELGAGKVLTGLAKRIDRDLEAFALGEPGEIDAFVSAA
ncbi:MAG: ACP S-malonyltransferase, partial [Alphaproteobacteria bacterium]